MSTAAGEQGTAPGDRRTAWKIVASVVVVVGSVGTLLYTSSMEGAEYYKFVDEVMQNPDPLRTKRLQVHGFVVERSIEQAKGTLQYRFKIESRPPRAPALMLAEYTGLVPDTFKSGSEVVAVGKLGPDNRLLADNIKAKCPSKYEATAKLGDTPATNYDKPLSPGSPSASPTKLAETAR